MKKVVLKFVSAIAVLLLVVFGRVFYNKYEKENAKKKFTAVEATVTYSRVTKSSRVTQKTILKLEYIYGGREIEKEIKGSTLSNFGHNYYQKGDVIIIYIDPDNENKIIPGEIIKRKND
ncbi:MAG: DUF3592 domain-containing protein [Prevotellaceae bacterium]|jgi:uncharacterized membrane protein|nr:DUF3592 domain-containing protein [Prevotellaceae bacterium]